MTDEKKIHILILSAANGILLGVCWYLGSESFTIAMLNMELVCCLLILMEMTK